MNQKEFLKQLGYKLKVARIERNLSQAELAAFLSRSSASIHKIETGKVNLGVYSFIRYCDVLKIKIGELI